MSFHLTSILLHCYALQLPATLVWSGNVRVPGKTQYNHSVCSNTILCHFKCLAEMLCPIQTAVNQCPGLSEAATPSQTTLPWISGEGFLLVVADCFVSASFHYKNIHNSKDHIAHIWSADRSI